jgi:hypothetical protein
MFNIVPSKLFIMIVPQTANSLGFQLALPPQNWGPGGGSARILHPYHRDYLTSSK